MTTDIAARLFLGEDAVVQLKNFKSCQTIEELSKLGLIRVEMRTDTDAKWWNGVVYLHLLSKSKVNIAKVIAGALMCKPDEISWDGGGPIKDIASMDNATQCIRLWWD